MTKEQEIESFLEMAGQAAAMADATSDPWLKAQWAEIAGACKDVAQSRMQGPVRAGFRPPDTVERGKDG